MTDDITRYVENGTVDNEVLQYAIDDQRAFERYADNLYYSYGVHPISTNDSHSFFVLKRNGKIRSAKYTDFQSNNVLIAS